jgi:LPS export ABC transporter permease LptG/LPS export ABC transporter permease LptF
MISPTLLGFGFYTFIIMMKTMFDLAELIIRRSLTIGTVGKLLLYSLPHIVVLTIPMALLLGILIAVGRLSADSEIVAMRSAGVSTARVYRPVFLFSFTIFLLTLGLMLYAVPYGNTAFRAMKAELAASSVSGQLKPRVFYDEYENLVMYVNDLDPTNDQWKGVFVSNSSTPDRQQTVIARAGNLTSVPSVKQVWLDLESAETHVYSPSRRDRYERSRNATQRLLIYDGLQSSGRELRSGRDYRSMYLGELLAELRRNDIDPLDRRLAAVAVHKKFAFPFACIAFGLVGLPLGITNRRGGKSSGFSLSIGIILFYYVVISTGEDLARKGSLSPSVAMWAPNLLLLLLGIYLMLRAGRERSGFARSRLTAWASRIGDRWRARRAEKSTRTSRSLVSRLDVAFPNVLDRYLLREFGKISLLVLGSTVVLFVVVDYATVIAAEVAEHRVPLSVVTSYYRYFIIQILHWALPITVLIGTLVTFGILSRNNEVTAIKSSGVSLYRVALPIVMIAAIISGVSYLMLDFVLPYANERVARLKERIEGKETATSFTIDQRQWIFGKGRYLFNFLTYDRANKVLSQVQVFEFDPVDFDLTRRIYADEARWDGVGWVFVNGWIRSFDESGESSYTPILQPVRLHYPERPEYFALEARRPEQMTYAQLRRHIDDLEASGYSSGELRVELYEKTSWPAISLVMALIALPFSFKIGKRGALYGIGIALFLAFVYWTFFGIFTKFGEVGNLPAILSAWSANILFALAAIYLFLRIET